ncbi:alpha/beta hydrolase family esterase [Amycolatopsis sp. NPDC098790]|uniref:alpha/beta hydrolase family esterase n=1 Tax=Amycolatopsis sp. NPDC098790 TaxID=3363939 RepID=UPI00381E598F
MSNGGGFTGLLACRLPGRIAAFAPVAGAFYPQSGPCTPPSHAALLDIHGSADTVIPYTGTPAKGLPALPDWLAAWAKRDQCGSSTSSTSGKVTHIKWQGCVLEHFKVDGLGHAWPSSGPDATSEIRRFFSAHPKG